MGLAGSGIGAHEGLILGSLGLEVAGLSEGGFCRSQAMSKRTIKRHAVPRLRSSFHGQSELAIVHGLWPGCVGELSLRQCRLSQRCGLAKRRMSTADGERERVSIANLVLLYRMRLIHRGAWGRGALLEDIEGGTECRNAV